MKPNRHEIIQQTLCISPLIFLTNFPTPNNRKGAACSYVESYRGEKRTLRLLMINCWIFCTPFFYSVCWISFSVSRAELLCLTRWSSLCLPLLCRCTEGCLLPDLPSILVPIRSYRVVHGKNCLLAPQKMVTMLCLHRSYNLSLLTHFLFGASTCKYITVTMISWVTILKQIPRPF